MIDLRNSNSKEAKIIYAAVIALAAIAIPVYVLWGETWDQFELIPLAIIIPFFYVVIVIGLILMALNVQVKSITSQTTDEKIINKYHAIQKTVKPYLLLTFLGYIIWLAFTLWQQLK